MGRIGEKTLQAQGDLGPLGRLGLFFRQVVAELRKVHRPTRTELIVYTVTLTVFVLVIMAYVASLDTLFRKLVFLVFSDASPQ
ncbi:MAG: preprotein translocase subunit SecE [Micrococcales bacterium]|nr:MAG: preprotein translocase subunit SecE [Micrococcales bacterium]PIE26234.1 MAG: preprotein translocase subunit SecE [Micrococcales bacterium]PIE26720.1 MAG: preprotein translocase subunit SecE [Micrococcales bacterium]